MANSKGKATADVATKAEKTATKKEPDLAKIESDLIAKYGVGSGFTRDGENAESDIVKGSLRFDDIAKKRMVTIVCRDNKEKRDVFTSDLFQVRGLSREGLRKAAAERRKAAKAANKVTVVPGNKTDAKVAKPVKA